MAEMINNPDFSVDDNSAYPQFMVFDKEINNVVPMTAENEATDVKWDISFWDALRKLFESIFQLIKESQATA